MSLVACGGDSGDAQSDAGNVSSTPSEDILPPETVKPEIEVTIEPPPEPTTVRIPGTFAISPDDGSLESFSARALVANFLVILDETKKDEKWGADIYRNVQTEIIGKRTIVPDGEFLLIDPSKFDALATDEPFLVVEWKYFGIDKGEEDVAFFVPLTYLKSELLGFSGREFPLEDKKYWVIFEEPGDLLFEEIIAPEQTQVYNYDSFADEAYNMINATFDAPETIAGEYPPIRTWHFDGITLTVDWA